MKNYFTFSLAICLISSVNAQIVTEASSLPDVNDELNYQTLSSITDAYLTSGEDVTWDFTGMYGDDTATEVYLPASEGAEAESFPDADMLIDFAGANAYAKRNTTNIEVIGIGSGGFIPELDDIEAQGLSSPFVVRRAPMGYGDSFSGETDFNFVMWVDPDSALGQLIGGLNPFPGTTVDSLRGTFTITRTEEIDAWGTAVFQNEEVDALRLVQQDDISTSVELYVNSFFPIWVDVSEFVDPETLGLGDVSTTNYIFLGATNKEHLLEITVDNTTEVESGRYSSDYYVGIEEAAQAQVSIYPNPAVDEILIDGVELKEVKILDQTGREVLTSTERLINVSELAPGTYLITGETRDGKLFTSRFQKH